MEENKITKGEVVESLDWLQNTIDELNKANNELCQMMHNEIERLKKERFYFKCMASSFIVAISLTVLWPCLFGTFLFVIYFLVKYFKV